jgi:hypothetical protein
MDFSLWQLHVYLSSAFQTPARVNFAQQPRGDIFIFSLSFCSPGDERLPIIIHFAGFVL